MHLKTNYIKITVVFYFLFLAFSSINAEQFIADYSVAKESVLRSIPTKYIDTARTTFHIAYQHTSHGTHVSKGLFGLQDYKSGDSILFGIKNNSSSTNDGKLDFYDYGINKSPYNSGIPTSSDLSSNETAFIQITRNFLDHENNADINVIMWSWCNIAGHDVANNYLPGMQQLIDEYGVGGSKLISGERKVPVTFIFMTGHANKNANVGSGKPKDQAKLITDYCNAHNYFCLDYYSIDTHDMDDNYWEDAGDDGNSSTGGNFYKEWQDSHTLGTDWFNNKSAPNGNVEYGAHNTQHITANRKAYAMWWILARIAGWNGGDVSINNSLKIANSNNLLLYQSSNKTVSYSLPTNGKVKLTAYNVFGNKIKTIVNEYQNAGLHKVLLKNTPLSNGVYVYKLSANNKQNTCKIILNK